MTQKTIILTGATSGIGEAAASELISRGHHLVLIGRDKAKTDALATRLGADADVADFLDLAQVRALGSRLHDRYERIDVLANNAGAIFNEREVTADGFEKTIQLNYIAHFVLTNILLDRLLATDGTVINTSSVAHRMYGRFNVDDLNMERGYDAAAAYGNAKTAEILHIRELHHRYGGEGLRTAAFHPGVVATGFGTGHTTSLMKYLQRWPVRQFLRTPVQGAETLVYLADNDDWTSGNYFVRSKAHRTSVVASDMRIAHTLWDETNRMLAR